MLSQKEAVYHATIEVIKNSNLSFDDGPVSSILNKEQRKLVVQKLTDMAKSNQINFRATVSNQRTLQDPKLLNSYLSNLVSNHWKRDSRLNGSKS